ncbi:MAG TPA: hypothetical protein PK090_06050 [Smithellaceae bacterium]|nr:hypothetical protein [Smithellaceae bacterium]
MKKLLLFITVAVVISSAFVYGQAGDNNFIEINVKREIPKEWGNLRAIMPMLKNSLCKELYFEDQNGTIRVVALCDSDDRSKMVSKSVQIIKRSY